MKHTCRKACHQQAAWRKPSLTVLSRHDAGKLVFLAGWLALGVGTLRPKRTQGHFLLRPAQGRRGQFNVLPRTRAWIACCSVRGRHRSAHGSRRRRVHTGGLTLREDIAGRWALKNGRALSATEYVVPYAWSEKNAAPERATLPSNHAVSSTDPRRRR
jgi:hypothetical protein